MLLDQLVPEMCAMHATIGFGFITLKIEIQFALEYLCVRKG